MISVMTVAIAALTFAWLPQTQHARAASLVGRPLLPPDEQLLAWVQRRRSLLPGQPRTAQLLQTVIAELTAGSIPKQAFDEIMDIHSPEMLRTAPPTVDRRIWQDVAAVWSASEQAGFSLATPMQRIHAQALVDQEIAREVQSNVAAPKFSIATMAVLPAAVWAMGSSFGANPLGFLFTSPVGWVYLVLGVALFIAAGLVVRRMIKSALA